MGWPASPKSTEGKVMAETRIIPTDGAANVPSLRTLGTGSHQALPGNTDVSGSAAVATETAARIAADNTEATTRAAADSTEQSARIAADSAEATARANADSTEATTRANADTAEATARANADTAEATARAGVQTNLNTHAALTTSAHGGLVASSSLRTTMPASYKSTSGLTVYYTSLDLTGATLVARTNTGVTEPVPGYYIYNQPIGSLDAFIVLWDEGDVTNQATELIVVSRL